MKDLLIFLWMHHLRLTQAIGITRNHQNAINSRIYTHDSTFKPDKILHVTAQNFAMDCTVRYSTIINGSIPGPELRFREGDKVWIRVYNDMPADNLTIHWHGLTQRASPFSDGTPVVSQWPIPPYHYFDYEFMLRPGDAGTYFYHAHTSFAAITAFGPFIVEEPPGNYPPMEYDDERTLMLSDLFYQNDTYIVAGLMGLSGGFRWSGSPQNIGLNGHSRPLNATANPSPSCSYSVITVSPGKLYRFRFIGSQIFSNIFLGFEGHSSLTIFEVDGHYMSPIDVDHIEIHTGQRYSVLFQANSAAELAQDRKSGKTQYWIQMETRDDVEIGGVVVATAFAVLAYSDAPGSPDVSSVPAVNPLVLPKEPFVAGWLEDDLHELPSRPYDDKVPMANEVTRRIIIPIQHVIDRTVPGGLPLWHQSGAPWFEHFVQEPFLVSLYKNHSQYFPDYDGAVKNGGYDPKTKTYPVKIGEVLEIVWQGLVGQTGNIQTHPFHAHGDHIWDISSGTGNFSESVSEAVFQNSLVNGGPIKRDTTNLYRTSPEIVLKPGDPVSWRTWRVRAVSPGVWMLHCHIQQHMMMGMQTVFVFGEANDLTPLTPEQAALYLNYGGPAYGNATYSPRVAHFWHDD